jgi:hypothetical protein
MAPLAEAPVGVTGDSRLGRLEPDHLDAQIGQQGLQLGDPLWTLAIVENHGCLQERKGAHDPIRVCRYGRGKIAGIWLAEQDGDEGRAVDDHQSKVPSAP